MSARNMQVAGVVAVAALGLGVFLSSRDKGSEGGGTKELVPVLEKRLNDVAAVRIEGGDAPFTLKKSGDRWAIEEKAGYPADDTKLRQLLIELRRARKLEQKTASPAGFAQLGVDEPDAEGSDSRAVVLLDAKGEEITRVIVGKRRFGKGMASGPVRADEESYVRVAGDASAWLAAGKLTFETAPLRWLDQAILDVSRDRLAAAEVARGAGDTLTLARATKDEFEMKSVTAAPEGREFKSPLGTSQVVNALAGLRFDDVAKAEGFEWPADGAVTTTFWTFDGLKVTAESVEKDGKTWARFRAEVVDKASRPGVPAESETVGPPPLLAAEDPLAADTAEGDPAGDAAQEPAVPAGPTPEELAAEAKKINDKVGGWVFVLPSWKTTAIKPKLDDLLAPLPAPPVDGTDVDAASPDGAANVDGGDAISPGAEVPVTVPDLPQGGVTPPTTEAPPPSGGVPPPAGSGSGSGG